VSSSVWLTALCKFSFNRVCLKAFQVVLLRRKFTHVSLTKARVASGLYKNSSEVIREVLRFMDTYDDWVHEIKGACIRSSPK